MPDITDNRMREILTRTRVIALVGYSANPDRPSNRVAAFLKGRGYRVLPVNPGLAGQVALGETVYPDLGSIPKDIPVDMVDIFRRSEDVPPVVEDALKSLPDLKTVWMQIGIRNAGAAAAARDRGLDVVEDRCPAIEIPRLGL